MEYILEKYFYTRKYEFFDLIMNSGIPDSGLSQTWFDDIGLIQWDSMQVFTDNPINITNPNDYNYIQFFSQTTPTNQVNITLKNSIIGNLPPLQSNPKSVKNIITAPGYGHFFDESHGPIGNWHWDFGNYITSSLRDPSHYFSEPGIYNISLTINGINNSTDTNNLTIIVISPNSEELLTGDLNNDYIINIQDLTFCASYILGLINFSPEQFIAADIDNNNSIEIYDIFYILAMYN